MARMYPNTLSPDTESAAERKLFRVFKQELLDSYVVFHSVAWLARDTRGGARDGEVDFIIAHPEQGILVLEVKGGNIRYDGRSNQWFSYSHPIKDPIAQARESKHHLLQKLKDMSYWSQRWLALGHAVSFPDVPVPYDIKWDVPEILVLDRDELDHITFNIERIFDYWTGEHAAPSRIGEEGIKELTGWLSPSVTIRPPLADVFAQEEEEQLQWDQRQLDLLDFTARRRRVAVPGCAGSGKTVLALEKARRLAKEGFRVLLTCYNYHLAGFLRLAPDLLESVEVTVYQELCERMAMEAGLADRLEENRGTREWYDYTLPELLLDAVNQLGPRYDAIVVDEGQNFPGTWWVPLPDLLQEPANGVFYIFYDNNQALYNREFEPPDGFRIYPLNRNYRNTRLIHQAYLPFYRTDDPPEAVGPRGRRHEIYYYRNSKELRYYLEGILRGLQEEQLSPRDVAILTPRSKEKSAIWRWSEVHGLRLSDRWPAGEQEILCTNVYRFQGLETRVVILAELSPPHYGNLDALLYVGCSRARNHLIILAATGLPEEIRQHLGEATVP
jgi:hypothetical protein